jgi:hypothetical protein
MDIHNSQPALIEGRIRARNVGSAFQRKSTMNSTFILIRHVCQNERTTAIDADSLAFALAKLR